MRKIFRAVCLALIALIVFQYLPGRALPGLPGQVRAMYEPPSAVVTSLPGSSEGRPAPAGRAADGTVHRYAILTHAWGGESYWWTALTQVYNVLTTTYGLADDDIYLLYTWGTTGELPGSPGENPGGIIDGSATIGNLRGVFRELEQRMDADDQLLMLTVDHGAGYSGEDFQEDTYGTLGSDAEIEPGDLGDGQVGQDYREDDFKLRSLYVGGTFSGHHGLNVSVFEYLNPHTMSRYRYVSTFSRVYFESRRRVLSDQDVYIERFVDRLVCDTNMDGMVDEYDSPDADPDCDGDGVPPYYDYNNNGIAEMEEFDQGDWSLHVQPAWNTWETWQGWDYFEDDVWWLETAIPGTTSPYVLFDQGFDNRLDIDINPQPGMLVADGTDLDGLGLFDRFDVNEDGDFDDWIAIDESFSLINGRVSDDTLSALLDSLDAAVGAPVTTVVIIDSCYAGGFIADVSAPHRIIMAASGEENYNYGTGFTRYLAEGLTYPQGAAAPLADADGDGRASMLELFNYATAREHELDNPNRSETPLYDDNGDRLGSAAPVDPASGGDGQFGANVYLED